MGTSPLSGATKGGPLNRGLIRSVVLLPALGALVLLYNRYLGMAQLMKGLG